jgi:hypothetical protein
MPPPAPEYPFDQVVADYFNLSGTQYLVYADRYTGWVIIVRSLPGEADAVSLQKHLRTLFGLYGAPRELSTDGGQPFNSHAIHTFLGIWGIRSRLSSAYNAQSNGRAQLAVKVAKGYCGTILDHEAILTLTVWQGHCFSTGTLPFRALAYHLHSCYMAVP